MSDMMYYSKLTDKLYDTQEELVADEVKIRAKQEEEKNKKAEQDKLLKEVSNARKNYINLCNKYEKKYGPIPFSLGDFNEIFKSFWRF